MADVCFVSMPYAMVENPSLSIGLLQSILKRDGIDTCCVYANVQFARLIGLEVYNRFHAISARSLVPEWTFAGSAFPEFQPDHDAFFGSDALGEALCELSWRVRAAANGFIGRLASAIIAQRPKIVGCSSAFAQQVSSLALLRRIREQDPTIVTMLGGPSCETEMGLATHRQYDWVDYVVSGEADDLITDLCQRILTGHPFLGRLPHGVLGPADRLSNYAAITTSTAEGMPRATARDLTVLPVPDYADYFRAIEDANLTSQIHPRLPIETSRGCWWGAHKQCTFCGQNQTAAGYRIKDVTQMLNEFSILATTYKVCRFQMVDNMIGQCHLQKVLPAMKQLGAPYTIFCESRSTLKRSDVRLLKAAGVKMIQVGIESLDSRVLTLMNKGTCAAHNIQMLKWASEFGVVLAWNMICGILGELDTWYDELADLIPLLAHLQPPSSLNAVRFDRFSPYFEKREQFGIDLVPARAYSFVYPGTRKQLMEQAFFFESTNQLSALMGDAYSRDTRIDSRRPGLRRAFAACKKWQEEFWVFEPRLTMEDTGVALHITDTRSAGLPTAHELFGIDRAILLACDERIGHTAFSLPVSIPDYTPLEIAKAVERLRGWGLLALVGGRMLTLATRSVVPFPGLDELPLGGITPQDTPETRGPQVMQDGTVRWKDLERA